MILKILLWIAAAILLTTSDASEQKIIRKNGLLRDYGRYINESGLVEIGGESYFIEIAQKVDWYSADAACKELKMQLLTLKFKEKNDLIHDWFQTNFYFWVWTGGHRDPKAEEWLWGEEDIFSYEDWGTFQPDVSSGMSACMNVAGHTDGWEDDLCSLPLNFMCEGMS